MPTYSVNKWDNDFKNNCKIRENLCEFPYEFGNGTSKSRFMLTTAQVDPVEMGYQSLPNIGGGGAGGALDRQGGGMTYGGGSMGNLGYMNQSTRHAASTGGFARGSSAGPRGRNVPLIRQAENLDENRIVLYKRSKQLGQGFYLVEISSNDTHLFIAAFDVETSESLLIELPEKRAQDILKEFDKDFEKMANSLQVMNKRLVLLNPVSNL